MEKHTSSTFAHLPPATTIDEVIQQLQLLIDDCTKTNDRLGYFAALYHKVTAKVKEGIEQNAFEDGPRMEKLDVLFANRYLLAVKQWQNHQPLSAPWDVAFNASKKSSLLVLQHLLSGMNAHINLDLGIAAAQVSAGHAIQDIHKDFNNINGILGSLVLECQNEINKISPLLSLMGLHAGNSTFLMQFSISYARDGSWAFAEDLSTKAGADFDACIAARNLTIKKLATDLVHVKGLLRFTIWIIHLFEWKRSKKIIKVLSESKKIFIHVNK